MLKGVSEAIVRDVVPVAIHDQPYVQITYSPLAEQEKMLETRLGVESAYPDLTEGDRVTLHILMNVVTKIEPSGDRDD